MLARLIAPWPLKLIFDFVLVPEAHDEALNLPILQHMTTEVLLSVLALAIVATAMLRAVSAYLSLVGLSVAASRIITEIRAD